MSTYAYTLLADGGTVDATTTGVKTVTISASVSAGDQLAMIVVPQGSPTTFPSYRGSNERDPQLGFGSAATILTTNLSGFQLTATGAIPASGTLTPGGGLSARVAIRAA